MPNDIPQTDDLAWIALLVMLVVLVLAAAFGCGPINQTAICRTRCGMVLSSPVPPVNDFSRGQAQWTCPELQRAEDLSMTAFDRNVIDPRFAKGQACASLYGVVLTVMPAPDWTFQGEQVSGLSFCGMRSLEVNNASPLQSTLTHELAHFAQNCNARTDNYYGDDPSHANWARDGIWAATSEVQAIGHKEYSRCFAADGHYIGPVDGGVCQ